MAYTTRRNQAAGRLTKRFVTSTRLNLQWDKSATAEDNATNIIGGATDDDTLFAPHDYHPVALAQPS